MQKTYMLFSKRSFFPDLILCQSWYLLLRTNLNCTWISDSDEENRLNSWKFVPASI